MNNKGNSKNDFEYYYIKDLEKLMLDDKNSYKVPAVLFDKKKYSMSADAIVLYAVLIDEMNIDFADKKGRLYINFNISEMSETINIDENVILNSLYELENYGLVEFQVLSKTDKFILYAKNFAVKRGGENNV